MKQYLIIILVTLSINPFSAAARADHLPLWELGVGMATMNTPDYRGSSESTNYTLPVPRIVYRGERFRIVRGGIRGMIFNTDRVELDLSLYGGPPVNSKNNSARRGMEDLDATVEAGPALKIKLVESDNYKTKLELNLPVRGVVSIDLNDMDQQGWIFYPHLSFIRQHPPHGNDWRFELSLGPLYGNKKYHDYYFAVTEADALPSRPVYQSTTGYSGSRLLMTYRRYLSDEIVFGAFAAYENLKNTIFEESPLLTDSNTFSMGVIVTWIFNQSDTRVDHD